MSTFSQRLRERRLDKQLTQKNIADALGISVTCYAGYEQGYREPDFDTLKKICNYLSVSADYLLGVE